MNDAGKVAFTPKGDYSSTVTYEYLDTVVYNGNAYVALKTTTGNAPTDENADENWKLLARGGTSVPVATEEVAGAVKASEDVGVADDGKMILHTDFTQQSELFELTGEEDRTTFFGKIAKAVSTLKTHMSSKASSSVFGHVKFGTVSGTACQGNDARLSDTRTPVSHASAESLYGAGSLESYGHVKLSDSTAVTDSTGLALPATEKNASKKGTMAYEISSLKISVTNLKSSAARPTLVDTEKFMFLGTPIIIKNNNIGTLQACVKMNAVYTSGNAVLQLPTGYRGNISNVACLVSENSSVTGVTADENGKIKFTSNISANTWVYINITYQITT